ncbi:MAG TPA: molybdopterin-dependent oxidoreductase [Abditibacteriaceae bacterium]|nr:molybdopterin-dependent oxidoreductase [Abditibacteriaceae bacterium]
MHEMNEPAGLPEAGLPEEAVQETQLMPEVSPPETDEEVERQIRRMSRRSFLWSAVAVGTGFSGWRWLTTRRSDDGIPWPFRRALEANGELARDYFSTARLAPTFPLSKADPNPRVNGDLGLGEDFDPDGWQLNVEGLASADGVLTLSLQEIEALPPVRLVMELKCIEGWSIFVDWTGARFIDFMEKYRPATRSGQPLDIKNKPHDLPGYVGLETPDGGYYVGLDMESARHPQTLLCYAMNGKPLTLEHGAPLRLVIPVKYGIKNIKRIGTIRYTNLRPADYWAEQGYDWYAGH